MSQVEEKKLATIVVSWNNEDILEECFQSLREQTIASDNITVLVDNNSSDGSVSLTKKLFPEVDVLDFEENLGFAAGNNRAIEYVLDKHPTVEYVVLLNSDARIADNWLETIYDFAKQKKKGAFFQSVTLDYYDHDVIDSSHIYIARNSAGTQAKWRDLYKGELGPARVFGVNFAAAMVNVDFIKEQPLPYLLDETMFMYLEDVDACARATVMGWENYTVPGTRAYHMGSASSNKRPGFSLYLTYRNNLALLVKNIPKSILMRIIPSMIRSDLATMRHLRRMGQSGSIKYIIKGRFVGLFRLYKYRKQISSMSQYRKSISKDYLWQIMRLGKL